MRIFHALLAGAALIAAPVWAQGRPDPEAQKIAMEKFRFLVGKWSGEAVVINSQGKELRLTQTEDVQFRLGGLILVVEGTGRDEKGELVFNALAVISFDQDSGTYKIRAWNAGSTVETEIKTDGKSFVWGFERNPVSVIDKMTLDEQGRWSETSDSVMTGGRKVHSVRMLLSKIQ